MEIEKTSICAFYDNRENANFIDNQNLYNLLEAQIKYLVKYHSIHSFDIIPHSDSDISFIELVGSLRKTLRHVVSCGIFASDDSFFNEQAYSFFRNRFCVNSVTRCYDMPQEDRIINNADYLLFIDDETKELPRIYANAHHKKIPIFLINPKAQTFQIIHSKYPEASNYLIMKSCPITHSLKKQLLFSKRKINALRETIHCFQSLQILSDTQDDAYYMAGELERAYILTEKMLKQEIDVIYSLVEFRNRALTTLYWCAKKQTKEARTKFNEELEKKGYRGDGTQNVADMLDFAVLEAVDNADNLAQLFIKKFNQKAMEKQGLLIRINFFEGGI